LSTRIDNLSNVARLRVSSLTRDLTSIADTKSFLENWEKGFKEFGKNFDIDYQIEGLDGGVMSETKTTDKPTAINLVFIDKDGKKIPLDGDFESLDIEGEHLELIVKVPNVKEIIPQRIPHRDPNDGDRHYHLFELNKENLELNANTIIREKDDCTRFHTSSTQFSITVYLFVTLGLLIAGSISAGVAASQMKSDTPQAMNSADMNAGVISSAGAMTIPVE
jgi:hypothetical protein